MKCLIDKKSAMPLDAGNIVLTEESMYKLPRPHMGQVVYTSDTYKTFVYKEDGWTELTGDVKVEGKGLEMNLYNLNQSIMSQLPTIINFEDKINLINEFQNDINNKYYMLFSKDISYMTMFVIEKYGEMKNLGEGVIECLKNIGDVKSIDYTETRDAIEIWIQQETNNPICAYLFPYDFGVVTIEEI